MVFEKMYSVYIMTNKSNSVFYVGVSSDLPGRVWEHKNKEYEKSFTARYNLDKLVYYEDYYDVEEAIEAEKRLKKWKRAWKRELIEKENPNYEDLSIDW